MNVTPELIDKYASKGIERDAARRLVKELVQEFNKAERRLAQAQQNANYWQTVVDAEAATLAKLTEATTV